MMSNSASDAQGIFYNNKNYVLDHINSNKEYKYHKKWTSPKLRDSDHIFFYTEIKEVGNIDEKE